LLTNAGWAAVFLSATLFLVHLGSLGLASSRLIAYIVHAIWTVVIARLIIQSQHDKNPPVLAAAISVEPQSVGTDVGQA
jgi:hypothetical protein